MKQYTFIRFILLLAVAFMLLGQTALAAEPKNTESNQLKTSVVKTKQTVEQVSKPFVNKWSDITPQVQTIVNADGTITVMHAANNSSTVEFYELDAKGKHQTTKSVKREFPLVGAFTKDAAGNYYVFYAKSVAEGAGSEINMALIKYSAEGKKVKQFHLPAQTTNDIISSVRDPFVASNCKIELSNQMIAVYFGRKMFVAPDGLNHQASYGFILNLKTFKPITGNDPDSLTMPYSSHSFNQFLLPIKNGFLFIDHGDAYPRSFLFSSLTNGKQNTNKSIESFSFKQGAQYQDTFAELGGAATTKNGYLFVGTYEKNNVVTSNHNDSRNIFLLTLDQKLSKVSEPIWITNYTDKNKQNAVFPKIVEIASNQYLLMWTISASPDQKNNQQSKSTQQDTYFTVVDQNGKRLRSISKLSNTPLNGFDTLRFNPKTGLVHWATEKGKQEIAVYCFDPLGKSKTNNQKVTEPKADASTESSKPAQSKATQQKTETSTSEHAFNDSSTQQKVLSDEWAPFFNSYRQKYGFMQEKKANDVLQQRPYVAGCPTLTAH